VNVVDASSVPPIVHRLPMCVPLLPDALVEAHALDEAVDVAPELDAELDRALIEHIDRSQAPPPR
jgi:hypothetical protein